MDAAHYRELLRPVFSGRKVIVGNDVLQGATGTIALLRHVDAERPFVIAGARGTGPEPSPDDAEIYVLDLEGEKSIMGGIRVFEAAIHGLPADVLDALDAYDPKGEALFLGTPFTRMGPVAGRRQYGGRPPEWEAIEDKTVVDRIFEEAGVERAPSVVVPVAEARAASVTLDRGSGTAWAGDNRGGWWGGAAYFRRVRIDVDAVEAATFLSSNCDTVRVMPFLDGIPCSIHAVVFPETVIVFRPVEMLTLRSVGSNQLLYAGLATYWDPPSEDREAMRAAARRLGDHLRERFGYRGTFTLDGVLTEEGFRPTEINPRPGAGLTPQLAAAEVHLTLINKMIIEGEAADYRPADLEELIVTKADERRGGATYTVLTQPRTETVIHSIAKRDGRFRVLGEGESGDGALMFGPSPVGSLIRYQPDVSKVEIGKSFAPTAVEVFAFADAEFGTSLGPLEAAREVR